MVNEPGAGQKPSPGQLRSGAFAPAAGQASSICTLCRDPRAFLLLRFEAPLPELLLDPARNRFNPASVGLPLAGCSRNRSGGGHLCGAEWKSIGGAFSLCYDFWFVYFSAVHSAPTGARAGACRQGRWSFLSRLAIPGRRACSGYPKRRSSCAGRFMDSGSARKRQLSCSTLCR